MCNVSLVHPDWTAPLEYCQDIVALPLHREQLVFAKHKEKNTVKINIFKYLTQKLQQKIQTFVCGDPLHLAK